jgi:hypothetical protein
VSYVRQLEAGFDHPGSAGLTVDRWGDSEKWVSSQHRLSSKTSGEQLKDNDSIPEAYPMLQQERDD